MKKNTGPFESRVPKVRINKELNKYQDVVLFPKKVAKAEKAIQHPSFKKIMGTINKKATK